MEKVTNNPMQMFDKPLPFLHHTCSAKQRQWACGIQKKAWQKLQETCLWAVDAHADDMISTETYEEIMGELRWKVSYLRNQVNPQWFIENKETLNA